MRKILLGLPTIFFALIAAGYFGVYRTLESADPNEVLPDWQMILFVNIPNLVTSSLLTSSATVVLLLAVLVGLTAEAYRIGAKRTGGVTEIILVTVAVVIALSLFVILQSVF